jgi:23S rRNA pseudouridine1911/1915/1917 synthase
VPERQVYHVRNSLSGQTLVAALREWLPGSSWNDAKKLLSSRRVSVNGAMCLDGGRRIRKGDVVHVYEHARTPQPTAEDVEIVYCDPHVVVAVKPALMTTLRHREERNWPAARKNLQPTLDEVLPRLVQEYERPAAPAPPRDRRRKAAFALPRKQPRGRPPRIIPVHRLDRDTSGVMVFARTPAAEQHLVRQFKKHSNERVYRALVHGHPAAQTIETYLVRDRGDGQRGSGNKEDGERALTHVRPLENLGDYSLVECVLETGRTHQIRIHLSELGHLVCGDPIYRKRLNGPPIDDQSGAPRLALHAARLGFDHPATGERLEFEVDLPPDLERFVAHLRRGRRAAQQPNS